MVRCWLVLVILLFRPGNAFQIAPAGRQRQHSCLHLGINVDPVVLPDNRSSINMATNTSAATKAVDPTVIIQRGTGINLTSMSARSRNDYKWLQNFEQLSEFRKQHGHCSPSSDVQTLSSWAKNQRKSYKNMRQGRSHSLTPYRVALLNSIGFVWSLSDYKWMEMYFEPRDFQQMHGHCDVPSLSSRQATNKRLARWVTQQRQKYKQATDATYQSGFQPLSQQQIQVLNDLNFTWNPRDDMWWTRYKELEKFKQEHGHCNVPQRYKQNLVLGKWCHHQKRSCKEYILSVMIEKKVKGVTVTGLTEERINALREIDFCWLPDPNAYVPPPSDIFLSWYSAK